MDDTLLLVFVGIIALIALPVVAFGLSESRSYRRQRALAVRRKDMHRL